MSTEMDIDFTTEFINTRIASIKKIKPVKTKNAAINQLANKLITAWQNGDPNITKCDAQLIRDFVLEMDENNTLLSSLNSVVSSV